MRESDLLNQLIRAAYPVVELYRINVGSVKTADGRWFSTGAPKGYPDLSGEIPKQRTKSGTALPIYIEGKVYPNKPTPEQITFLEKKKADGCIAGVCY